MVWGKRNKVVYTGLKQYRHTWVQCSAEGMGLIDVLPLTEMLSKQEISFMQARQPGRRQEAWSI